MSNIVNSPKIGVNWSELGSTFQQMMPNMGHADKLLDYHIYLSNPVPWCGKLCSIPRMVPEKVKLPIFCVYFMVTLLIPMSKEEQQQRLDLLKAVWVGHRSVITKLSRELNGIIESAAEEAINTNPRKVACLKVIYEQLNRKLEVFNNLDGDRDCVDMSGQ